MFHSGTKKNRDSQVSERKSLVVFYISQQISCADQQWIYLLTSIVCVFKAWFILFLCAIELHCCPLTLKNTSMNHTVTLGDNTQQNTESDQNKLQWPDVSRDYLIEMIYLWPAFKAALFFSTTSGQQSNLLTEHWHIITSQKYEVSKQQLMYTSIAFI